MVVTQGERQTGGDRDKAQYTPYSTGVASGVGSPVRLQARELTRRVWPECRALQKNRFEETLAMHAGMLGLIAASYEARHAAREDLAGVDQHSAHDSH
ncbi:MAG: hypothetical protein L0I62_04115 [Gammaproteobacteria bacterium]|nr:hypothetical protein [Gammaproteobacteria bacterium]